MREIDKDSDVEFIIDHLVEYEVPVGDLLRDALERLRILEREDKLKNE